MRSLLAPEGSLVVEETGPDLLDSLRKHIKAGERFVVAAGGDGTVHQVANCLMQLSNDERSGIRLGALALGSSNDFHKPKGRGSIAGVGARLAHDRAAPHNIVRCSWRSSGAERQEYFLANASMGIVADANRLYNTNRGVAGAFKRLSVSAAITYCSLATLFGSRNQRAVLTIDGASSEHDITNIGILLNPHFGGGLRYDMPIDPAGETMCVQLCEGMSPLRKLLTFVSLALGRFTGLPKTRTWWCRSVRIEAMRPFAFEMDGEVREMTCVDIQLFRDALSVCP